MGLGPHSLADWWSPKRPILTSSSGSTRILVSKEENPGQVWSLTPQNQMDTLLHTTKCGHSAPHLQPEVNTAIQIPEWVAMDWFPMGTYPRGGQGHGDESCDLSGGDDAHRWPSPLRGPPRSRQQPHQAEGPFHLARKGIRGEKQLPVLPCVSTTSKTCTHTAHPTSHHWHDFWENGDESGGSTP